MRPRGTGERRGAAGQRGEGNNLNDGNSGPQNGTQGVYSQKNGGDKFDPNDQGSSSGEPQQFIAGGRCYTGSKLPG